MLAACNSSGGNQFDAGLPVLDGSAVDAAEPDGSLRLADSGLSDASSGGDAAVPHACKSTGIVLPTAIGKAYSLVFPRLVWDGGRYGMVWQEGPGTGRGGVRFAFLDEEGGFDSLSIQRLTELELAGEPRLAFSGTEYAVSFYGAGRATLPMLRWSLSAWTRAAT